MGLLGSTIINGVKGGFIGGLTGLLGAAYSKYGPLVLSSLQPSSSVVYDDRAFAVRQAQKQMDFQERMSNTAYQRATQDLIKAGLNPGLLYSASAASTPSGSMATTPATMSGYEMNRENNNYRLMDTTLKGMFQTLNTALGTLQDYREEKKGDNVKNVFYLRRK